MMSFKLWKVTLKNMDNPQQIRVVTMLGVLKDKAGRQKNRIQKILSMPRAERNKQILKKLLKENHAIRKILKTAEGTIPKITCPHCGEHFILENENNK